MQHINLTICGGKWSNRALCDVGTPEMMPPKRKVQVISTCQKYALRKLGPVRTCTWVGPRSTLMVIHHAPLDDVIATKEFSILSRVVIVSSSPRHSPLTISCLPRFWKFSQIYIFFFSFLFGNQYSLTYSFTVKTCVTLSDIRPVEDLYLIKKKPVTYQIT